MLQKFTAHIQMISARFHAALCSAIVVTTIGLLPISADAAYTNRYSTTTRGALTFTGNSLGLSMQASTNAPGTDHSIGAFMSTNTALQDGTYPMGTTANWMLNSSAATLTIPSGSSILYAELIWGGTSASTLAGTSLAGPLLNTPVSFTTPSGTTTVTPDPTTNGSYTDTDPTNGFTWYIRSANVTSLVQAAGAGTYTVGGVPGLQDEAEVRANGIGWTLAVAYANPLSPARNLTVFVGAEPVNLGLTSSIASLTGICTPSTAPVNGRVLVTTLEGDASLTGDAFRFGPTTMLTGTNELSGPNNPVANFFASQINGDAGTLNATGTFGTRNHDATLGANTSGGRQGWDITNVDASMQLSTNQTQAFAQGTTSNEGYLIAGIGLQVDAFSPTFPTVVKTANRTTTFNGDTITYTINLTNNGSTTASGIIFNDPVPTGTTFVPGSFTINGTPQPGVTTPTGVAIPPINAGQTTTVTLQVLVTAASGATIRNGSNWSYTYSACSTTLNASTASNEVAIVVGAPSPDIRITKTHSGAFTAGQIGATYSLTVGNLGPGSHTGTITVTDIIPAGMTLTSASGPGWTCSGTSTVTCTRSDTLPSGTNFADITLTVNIAPGASGTISNTATVAGGGTDPNPANNSSTDATTLAGGGSPALPVPSNAFWAMLLLGLFALYLGARRFAAQR